MILESSGKVTNQLVRSEKHQTAALLYLTTCQSSIRNCFPLEDIVSVPLPKASTPNVAIVLLLSDIVPVTNVELEKCAPGVVETFTIVPPGNTPFAIASELRIPCRYVAVVGNETAGLSTAWRDACDDTLRIPISGSASSLNAAAAASIVLYQAALQRGTGRSG